jgi:hypothetical protein
MTCSTAGEEVHSDKVADFGTTSKCSNGVAHLDDPPGSLVARCHRVDLFLSGKQAAFHCAQPARTYLDYYIRRAGRRRWLIAQFDLTRSGQNCNLHGQILRV